MPLPLDVAAIDGALNRLSSLRRWPARAIDTFEAASVLLELTSVRIASERLDLGDRKAERVAALRSVLRSATARVSDPGTRAAIQVYFGLLDDDEREAIAELDAWPSLDDKKDRQAAASRLLGIGSSVRGAEEVRLRGILCGSLMIHEVTVRHSELAQSGTGTTSNPREDIDARVALELATERLYPGSPALDSLAQAVVPFKPPWLNTKIRIELTDHPTDPSLYLFRPTLRFQTRTPEYVVAVVTERELCQQILTLCPRVSEVIVVPGQDAQTRTVARLTADQNRLMVHRTSPGGATRWQPVGLRAVDGNVHADLLADLVDAGGDAALVAIVRADVGESYARGGITGFRLAYETAELRAHPFCYWLTDRPTHVTEIEIDTARLTTPALPNGLPVRVKIHPFLMATTEAFRLDDHDKLRVEINSWIVAGHGIGLTW